MTQVGGEKSGDRPDDLDVIWGAEGIAKVIRRTKRQTLHMLQNGRLPARKVGSLWCSSHATLRRHFDSLLDGNMA